jgi:hypothetical protein
MICSTVYAAVALTCSKKHQNSSDQTVDFCFFIIRRSSARDGSIV